MKKFVDQNNLPVGEILFEEELQAISIPITEIEEVIKKHTQPGKFPVHIIPEIKTIIALQPIISLESGFHINQF